MCRSLRHCITMLIYNAESHCFHLSLFFLKNTFPFCAFPLTICCCTKILNNFMDVLKQSILKKNATTLRLCTFGTIWKSSYRVQHLHYASWYHNCTKETYSPRNCFQSMEKCNELQEEKLPHYFNIGICSTEFNTIVKIYLRFDTPPLSVLL